MGSGTAKFWSAWRGTARKKITCIIAQKAVGAGTLCSAYGLGNSEVLECVARNCTEKDMHLHIYVIATPSYGYRGLHANTCAQKKRDVQSERLF
ncbi:hypothetical protein [Anaplasma marginale]|uniref:hypothetical protein n=2 Tax=Anaplasma marginale TaxID=770 RepID=UPI0012392194|nr:hypothetical protein [Anaplasma marginale]KAA8473155.1 hypothetical protein F0Q58_00660 [Anaplasma marginale]KAB0451515.1 hypothetical protein FY210_00660 [Anaplasma marginale]KAB0453330.1 hypothetical protein FY192_00290 [Anaplasma marginale]